MCSVLKGSEFMFAEKAPAHHPAAICTAKFCIQEIEKSGGGSPAEGRVRGGCKEWAGVSAPLCWPGSREATTTLHMLTLLKDLLPCFPEGMVKSCSETLLRVMTLSHVVSSDQRANGWDMPRGVGAIAADPRPTVLDFGELCGHAQSRAWGLPDLSLLLATNTTPCHPV